MVVASNGRIEAIELLIERGIDVNAIYEGGRNTFMIAIERDSKK